MKMIFRAYDGSDHPTESECRAHDETIPEHVLANRSVADILAGLARLDLDVANALEKLGVEIARKRRAAGEFRRERSEKPEPPPLCIEGPRAEPPSDTEQSIPDNEVA